MDCSDFDKDDQFLISEEKKMIEEFCKDTEDCNDIALKILSLLSSLCKNDWRFCIFFSTFIYGQYFTNCFTDDENYKNKIDLADCKEFYDNKKNNLWLLDRVKGEFDDKKITTVSFDLLVFGTKHNDDLFSKLKGITFKYHQYIENDKELNKILDKVMLQKKSKVSKIDKENKTSNVLDNNRTELSEEMGRKNDVEDEPTQKLSNTVKERKRNEELILMIQKIPFFLSFLKQ